MQRTSGWVGVVLFLAALVALGYCVVKYVEHRPPGRTPGKHAPGPDESTPLSLAELATLEGKSELAEQDIARLLGCFRIDDEDVRLQAELILAKHPGQSLERVRARLNDANEYVRFSAAETLGLMGPPAASTAQDLVVCLGDNSGKVRYKAAYALGRLGVQNEAVCAALVGTLADSDDHVRDTAIEALEKFKSLPKETAPALVNVLGSRLEHQMRGRALVLLARLGDPAVAHFRLVIQSLKPEVQNPVSYEEYVMAVNAVELFGPAQAKALLPELTALLDKVNHAPQGLDPALLHVFKNAGGDGAKHLAETLKKAQKERIEHNNRLMILQALGEMGDEAKSATPVLVEVLVANTPTCTPIEYRPAILDTLGAIGPAAREATPAVEALLNEPALADEARGCLRRMGVAVKKKD